MSLYASFSSLSSSLIEIFPWRNEAFCFCVRFCKLFKIHRSVLPFSASVQLGSGGTIPLFIWNTKISDVAHLFGNTMPFSASLLALGHGVLSWECEWPTTKRWQNQMLVLLVCLRILPKHENLLIKLSVFRSNGRPRIPVLSLNRKAEIPLPKRQAVHMDLSRGSGCCRRGLLWGVTRAFDSPGLAAAPVASSPCSLRALGS